MDRAVGVEIGRKAKADPYGMTTKERTKAKSKQEQRRWLSYSVTAQLFDTGSRS
jgi:hypothetical protein